MSDNRKFVIFDLDGTLIDSFECVLRCVNKALAVITYPPICSDQIRGKTVDDLFESCRELIGDIDDYYLFKKYFDFFHDQILTSEIKIIPVAYELLRKYVGNGVFPIILTNKKQNIAQRLCSQLFQLNSTFIIGRRTVFPLKNNHKKVISRLNEAGVNLKDCIHFYGDSEQDLKLSKKLKIPFTQI